MAKFVYRMQNILNIKQKLETQAKMTYSLANQKYLEQQKILQNIWCAESDMSSTGRN